MTPQIAGACFQAIDARQRHGRWLVAWKQAPTDWKKREGGFTFIEVMVALAIFAFAGIVLASAYANVLTAQKAIFEGSTAAPDSRLVRQALFAEPDLKKVSQWNDLPLPAGRSARWRAVVTPTTLPDLFDVVLEIDGLGEGHRPAEIIRENLRLLRPTWSNKSERALLLAVATGKIFRHPQP